MNEMIALWVLSVLLAPFDAPASAPGCASVWLAQDKQEPAKPAAPAPEKKAVYTALVGGDVCAFVTDGVSEAIDAARRPWKAAVLQSMRQAKSPSAEGVCEAIVSLAEDGHGPQGVEDWTDDRTVIVVRVVGSRT